MVDLERLEKEVANMLESINEEILKDLAREYLRREKHDALNDLCIRCTRTARFWDDMFAMIYYDHILKKSKEQK